MLSKINLPSNLESSIKVEATINGRIRRILSNLALLAVSSLVCLVLAEIVLWTMEPRPLYEMRENEFEFYAYDELLGWKNRANQSGVFYMPDSMSWVQINSKGLRDRERDHAKHPG